MAFDTKALDEEYSKLKREGKSYAHFANEAITRLIAHIDKLEERIATLERDSLYPKE